MVYRVDHREKLPRPSAVAQLGKCHGRPDRPVGVLPAVFPHAGDVAFDVAGIQVRIYQRVGREAGRGRRPGGPGTCPPRPLPSGNGRRHRHPTGRTSFALSSRSGIQGCPPSREGCHHRSRPGDTTRRPSRALRCCGEAFRPRYSHCLLKSGSLLSCAIRGEAAEHVAHEEREPDALAFAFPAHHVHAVVPVAGTDEGKAVFTEPETPSNGPHTMIVETGRLPGPARKIIVGVLLGIDRAPLDEVDRFVQYPRVAGTLDVAARCEGEPEEVVGTVGAHPAAYRRVPPVLDISFGKLAARAR